jgi:GT2 family glycosyltransferase
MVFGVSARPARLARPDVVLAVRQHDVAPMPEETTPRVSAVILAYNRADALDVVIERLAGVPVEEIVVMNAGEDGTADVARRDPRVTVVEAENIGIANRNLGARQASGELLLMLDDDSYPLPGAVEAMREVFERDPGLGVLGGFVRDVDESGLVNAAVGPGSFDWFLRAGQGGEPADGMPSFFFPEGACMMRRDALLEAGGWFEPYYLALSELDVSTRMIAAGWDVRYLPTAPFDHMKASGGMRGIAGTLHYRIRNQIWYFWLRFPVGVAVLRIPFYLTFDLIESSYRGVVRAAWLRGIADAWRERDRVRGLRRPLPRAAWKRAEMNRGRMHLKLLWGQLRRRVGTGP